MKNYEIYVAIIVLNWNGLDDTIECINSLKKVTYPYFDIIIVDNGSEGNDVEALNELFGDTISLVKNETNLGYAGGNNTGINYALNKKKYKYIVTLNNDTTVDKDFIFPLIDLCESDERIGMIGPKIYYYYKPKVIWFTGGKANYWTCGLKNISKNIKDNGEYDFISDVDTISGCIHFMSRRMLEDIGLYETDLPPGYDNIEICFRCKKHGYRVVYNYNSKIYHKIGRSREKISKNPEKYAELIKYRGIAGLKARFNLFRKYSTLIHYPTQIMCTVFIIVPQMIFNIYFDKSDPSTIKDITKMLCIDYKNRVKMALKKIK